MVAQQPVSIIDANSVTIQYVCLSFTI
jgi:hypothetical protein